MGKGRWTLSICAQIGFISSVHRGILNCYNVMYDATLNTSQVTLEDILHQAFLLKRVLMVSLSFCAD